MITNAAITQVALMIVARRSPIPCVARSTGASIGEGVSVLSIFFNTLRYFFFSFNFLGDADKKCTVTSCKNE